jgi:hypothetical protein
MRFRIPLTLWNVDSNTDQRLGLGLYLGFLVEENLIFVLTNTIMEPVVFQQEHQLSQLEASMISSFISGSFLCVLNPDPTGRVCLLTGVLRSPPS